MSRLKWLETQLDREDLTDEEFELYNKEANELQSQINASRARQIKEREDARQAILDRITVLAKEGRMAAVVEEFGQQFAGDYSYTDDFQVRSAAYNERNPNLQNTWQFSSKEECLEKINLLIYWRVYDHYFRDKGKQ